jgi:hypothetical protein
MATTYTRASVQGTSGVGTYATLYTAPSATTAVISTIAVVNTASANATYRIGFASSATTPAAADWLIYDGVVPANDTLFLSVGATITAGTFIRVSSSANTVSFQAFVSEIS